jgi:hypothetical protein
MNKKSLLLILFLALPHFVFSQSSQSNLSEIKANLEHLASDEMMGRGTLTEGEILASEFIATKLAEYGVKPYGDNGTYFLNFPLLESKFLPSSKIEIFSGGKKTTYEFKKDFIIDARRNPGKNFLDTKSKIVFAGFGISAPEYNYDDYAKIDVKGKTVFVLDDEPLSSDSTYFRGMRPTQYSFWGTKWRQARERGAAGLVIIATADAMSRWKELGVWGEGAAIRYPDSQQNTTGDRIPVICVSIETAKKLLEDEKFSFDEISEKFNEKKKIPVFELGKEINFLLAVEEEEKMSRNVIGIIEGTHAVLKKEIVSLGAHYDHEGIKNGEVYNGADDNASGTVTVMDVAKRIASSNENKRSVVVMLYSAEEKGLMGSKYISENADYVKDMVANINMDMIGRMSEDTLFCIGASKLSTELGRLVEEVNARTSNFYLDYTFDAPNDPNRFYERSDHYNFAKVGIPIAFLFDNMNDDYHKPSDDSHKINYAKILKVSDLVYGLTLEIANLGHKLTVDGKN